MTTDQTAWWHVADFDKVVNLAVTELYQDGRDSLIVDDPLGSLHVVVADTLRNVHFMEVRKQRDVAHADVVKLRDAVRALYGLLGRDADVHQLHAVAHAAMTDTEHYEKYRTPVGEHGPEMVTFDKDVEFKPMPPSREAQERDE